MFISPPPYGKTSNACASGVQCSYSMVAKRVILIKRSTATHYLQYRYYSFTPSLLGIGNSFSTARSIIRTIKHYIIP